MKIIQPYRIAVKRNTMEKEEMKKPGSTWGTGRPSTGRTHPVTIRLSDYAFEALSKVKNKSLYIDSLIRIDNLTGILNSK